MLFNMKLKAVLVLVLVLIAGVVGVNMLNQESLPVDDPLNNGTVPDDPVVPVNRESLIPENKTKRTPETDHYPPILHSSLWEAPVPMPYPISTAGAEDSPFMDSCGCYFYFVFVPDVDVPVQGQLVDGVTGLWVSKKTFDGWGEPVKV